MELDIIEIVRRREVRRYSMLIQIGEYQHLNSHSPLCAFAICMLEDQIKGLLEGLNGMAGEW